MQDVASNLTNFKCKVNYLANASSVSCGILVKTFPTNILVNRAHFCCGCNRISGNSRRLTQSIVKSVNL